MAFKLKSKGLRIEDRNPQSINDLTLHLNLIIEDLKQRSDIPAWNKIRIVEGRDIQHCEIDVIPESSLKTPEAYSPRFQELLDRGYGWMNLVNNGIVHQMLLLSIEIPQSPSGIPPSQVPINLSGPYYNKNGTLCWDASSRIKIV